ncbi:MAG: D-sedoheptulose-7-phosphate isomerase [Planctomycetota bacterium]|jgi:D-sedoheptulose 7-phosphate isomerase
MSPAKGRKAASSGRQKSAKARGPDKELVAKVDKAFDDSRDVAEELAASTEIKRQTAEVASLVLETLRSGGKVLLCGNGGSAADAQHIAAEFVGRFRRERMGLCAMALTTDSSIMTSVANDYGYAEVFRRQVEALGRRGDVLIGISTSGNAENILRAVEEAKRLSVRTVGLTGARGGKLAGAVDIAILCPSSVTARIQECHATIGHTVCEIVEEAFAGSGGKA